MRIAVFDVSGSLDKFNGVSFAVCEGVGDLDYRDYSKNLNFSALLTETIENYLLNNKEPKNKQQKALLMDFLEIYDKNIEKGFIYLKPKFFLEKEKQLIETTTKLLTSYQIFLNNAKESANNEINTNQTQAITNINEAKNNANNEITANQTQALNNINEAKVSATNQINTNKQEVLNNITQQKQQAYSEITEAKNTIIIKTLIFFEIE